MAETVKGKTRVKTDLYQDVNTEIHLCWGKGLLEQPLSPLLTGMCRHVPPLGAGVSSGDGRQHILDQWLTVCGRRSFSLSLPRV